MDVHYRHCHHFKYFEQLISYASENKNVVYEVIIPYKNIFNTSDYYNDILNAKIAIPDNIKLIPLNHRNTFLPSLYLKNIQKKKGGSGSPIIYYLVYYLWLKKIIKTYNFHEVCEIKLENETPIFDYYNDKKLDKLCSLDKGVYLWVLKEHNKPFEVIYIGLLDKSTLKGRNGFHGNGFKDKGGSKSGKKLKDGIGKKILRQLLSECDYFEVIKEENPFVYDTIKEKIKYLFLMEASKI